MRPERIAQFSDPDPEADRLALCEGKIAMDAPHAFAAAKRKKRSAYKCRFCGKWHVGTRRMGKRQ